MTIEGKGPYQIARELSEEKIERPSYYLGKKGLGNHASNYDKENPYMWRGNQVTTLIARPEYIGKTVNFRTFKNSYKDKKTKRADKEDWVVFDDTQEPIVDEETWLLAQKLRQNVRKADPMGEPNVLTGKIYRADVSSRSCRDLDSYVSRYLGIGAITSASMAHKIFYPIFFNVA
jgi:hypothetical protein